MTNEEIKALELKHFNPEEDKNIDWDVVDPEAIKALDNVREDCGIPLWITSNHREINNPAGTPTDAHREVPCTAFDIRMSRPDGKWDSAKAFKLIPIAIKYGFNRIGINSKNNHVHLDRSKTHAQDVLFIE